MGYIIHSAKGTSWSKKDHKYIKKEKGRYFYNVKQKAKKVGERAKEIAKDTYNYLDDKTDRQMSHIIDGVASLPRDLWDIFADYANEKYDEFDNKRKRKAVEKEINKKIDKGYAFVYDNILKKKR